ncbi:hypothetical protein AB6A40_001407 [Gnathostoma spinigerum]|uniref:Patched family protein n=1 Tax=Gnathostoma spinigerum TaxID=75299 RepID=A0ABD6ECZ3_9BILA
MRLRQIVDDFERLPSSLGEFSTKFWLRDYDAYIAASNNDESELQEPTNNTLGELITPLNSSITRGITANDIQEFLDWPEYEFWNGFLQFIQDESGETKLDKFFFTTAFHGVQLHRWSARSALKAQWRRIADMYPDLGVSIYQDHGIFLDVIPSILPQALQSTFFTLLCMIVVCLLVFVSLDEVVVAAISIVSICIGVCGYLSFCGVNLDPIVMSAMIMSIGFSVDIPAHIIYHFYKIPGTNVEARLERCLQMLIMPVLQAALSTDLCVLSLLVADVPMTWSFVQTVICVITLGLIHGIVVIPVVFYLYSLLPRRRRREAHLARIAPFTVTIDPNVDKSQTQITSPSV